MHIMAGGPGKVWQIANRGQQLFARYNHSCCYAKGPCVLDGTKEISRAAMSMIELQLPTNGLATVSV